MKLRQTIQFVLITFLQRTNPEEKGNEFNTNNDDVHKSKTKTNKIMREKERVPETKTLGLGSAGGGLEEG